MTAWGEIQSAMLAAQLVAEGRVLDRRDWPAVKTDANLASWDTRDGSQNYPVPGAAAFGNLSFWDRLLDYWGKVGAHKQDGGLWGREASPVYTPMTLAARMVALYQAALRGEEGRGRRLSEELRQQWTLLALGATKVVPSNIDIISPNGWPGGVERNRWCFPLRP